jgi:hypothetical protein
MTFEISRHDPRDHADDLLGRGRVEHLRQHEAGGGDYNQLFSAPASLVPRALRAPSFGSFCTSGPAFINSIR